MVWFKVDDGFANSRPVLRISRRYRSAAVGLWTLAGAWSAKELTDGYVPEYVLEELCGTTALAARLVEADLWTTAPDGWKFKGWEKYQPLRADVMEGREKEAERKRLTRASGKRPGGQSAESQVDKTRSPDTPSRPDPTRPDHKTRLPESSYETRPPADVDLIKVKAAVMANCGRDCSDTDAFRIIGTVMERSKITPKNPTAYVVKAIATDPFTFQQLLDEGDAA